nr:MAG TPA: Neck appendage protein [Caudoviricetes sp.]
MPLNAAYVDEIVQEENSTYQLSFRFPTSDPLWEKLKEETFLTADDLHGEQDFVIFEVEKKHGYIQVYANQVFTLLNNYVVNPISLDRQTGSTALSRFAGNITRDNPFSFFSDIEDRHTFNIGSKNAMEAFAKDKHSIIGQWGGDLVRHGYQVRLLKNGGSENESLFMYKKNLSSYQHKTSTKSLKTRITFVATVKGEGEKAPDRTFTVTIDSPLINKYSQIYEDVIEVNDQDVKDEASLRRYGEQYYRTSLCDMMEDSLEIEVVGQSDVPVQMFDVVSIFHERYNLDVRKKITKYTYSPMAKKLKSIGFGQFQSGLANAIGNAVSDAVKGEAQQLHDDFERQLARELKNADLAFDRQKEELVNQFTDGLNAAKTRAEEVKRELSDNIDQRFNSFNNGPLQEAKRRAEETLRNAGASSLLAQEAKRIGLDSIAKLEEFKRQSTSAQTALSGDLDVLKRTIANDIRPKQEQVTAEIEKQVKALIQTKNELAGVKSAQATYEETTTRRLAELTNLANGKASKSELTQTAEELASKLASVQASGRNLFLNSLFKQDISKTGIWTTSTYTATIDSENKYLGHNALKIIGQNPSGRDGGNPKITYPALGQFGKVVFGSTTNQDVTISFYAKANKNGIMLRSRLGNIGYKNGNVILSTEIKRYVVHIPKNWTNWSVQTTNEWLFNFNQEGTVWIWMPKFEISDVDTSYSEAPEDIEGQISAVESSFRQRADALDAGVSRLTEGLRTKADISSLNVTAESIRQSVKSLGTNTQNQLNQMLSLAEFEVRAGSIRQEILNATKDKADKTLVVAEAGKLREEFSNLRIGSRNYAEDYDFSRGLWIYSQGDSSPVDWKIINGEYNVKGTTKTWKQMQIHSKEGSRSSWKSSTALLELEIGETYTLSFQGICYSGSPKVWLSLRANRTVSGNPEIINGNFNLTSSWQTYQVTIPALTKPDNFDFWRIILGYNEIGHVAFRKVELTRSSTRIDAGPAPEDGKTDLIAAKATFERTAQGLRTELSAIQSYVDQDGQRQETLKSYARNETITHINIYRQDVARNYILRSRYDEDAKSIRQQFEAITNSQNGLIATKIADYKHSIDGKFTDISSQITTYKQDVGGQISGLSNRLTSSEQGTTTQISNLKTQVATNKDNAERQMGRISDQVSVNKANADSQFSNVTSQLARKVEITDFQRVKETSQLYERILGNTENGIVNNVARMALTSQMFQVEVGKAFANHQNLFLSSTATKGFLGNAGVINVANNTQKEITSDFISVEPNSKIIFQHWVTLPENGMAWTAWQFFDKNKNSIDIRRTGLNAYKTTTGKQHNINQIIVPANAYFIRVSARMYNDGLIKIEHGSVPSDYSVAPNDALEAVKTVQSQLAGSWSVQNINSAGSIVSQINATNNQILIEAEKIRLKGKTLLDELTAIQGYFKRLFVGEGTFATLNSDVIRTNSITADKLVFNEALANRLVSNEHVTNKLVASRAFVNALKAVTIDASQIVTGTLKGDRIYGGTIRGTDIYGATLTGHTQIQLGSYGSFDTVNGGLQINVPRTVNARDGLGVQFIGSYGRGENVPYGIFIYKDTDFTTDNYASDSDDFLLTVEGYIKAKGIGWLKTVKGNVGGKDTASIGFWNSDVSLDFGGSGNDIYYRYAGKAYGLWSIINQHFSDRRLKENIVDCKHNALDYIHQFQFKEYDWKKEEDRPLQAHTKIGLIAQEVQAVDPTLVYENGDTLNLDNLRLTNIALKAIQELALENQKLTQRLENLENERRTA